MLIACNARFLIRDKLEGIGWFTYEALKRMVTQHPEHNFAFFFDRPFDPSFLFAPNVKGYVLPPPARHPWLWKLWFDLSVPYMLRKLKADVFLSTDGFASLHTRCRQVVVMHDLAFEHFQDHVPPGVLRYYRHNTPRFAAKASRLATVSSFTKNDLVNRYAVSPDKIDVVFNGSSDRFRMLSDAEKAEVRLRFSGGKPYFLYAGAMHPRKNTTRLFRAFADFKKKTGSALKLVIAGRRAWSTDEAMKTWENMPFKEEVIFLGHLNRDELTLVMGAAYALVYPSLFEGFGIPIVEAMHCGVPVITSNVSSMPEVAGDAALLVNPYEEKEISAAMVQLAEDAALYKKLAAAGLKQQEQFSWASTGDRLWECIERAMRQ